jgi:serine/tyrosine/threonine adenylyltransferase
MTQNSDLLISPTQFETHFSQEEGHMFSRVTPQALEHPKMIAVSQGTAQLLGLNSQALAAPSNAEFWAGNWAADSADTKNAPLRPIAAVYSGHQFGVWAGQLGDGRAMSLGSLKDIHGQSQELQFKGAGTTPYSRGADGRAVLRSSCREFLCSEAMVGLGIPTTRVLTFVGSDTPVFRENLETAAVVTRVAPSFIRFGSFEHYLYNDQPDRLRALANFVIDFHYPDCRLATNPFAALLAQIVSRSAQLVAQWQSVGFCHGVLNTDNMSILGLTIDYGPFGFLDSFDPAHICNHTDRSGRYSYQNQPSMVQWNCYALGQTMVPLIGSVDETKAILGGFKALFETAMKQLWQDKLGLNQRLEDDDALVDSMFDVMQRNQVDWTLWFRSLSQADLDPAQPCTALRDLCLNRDDCDAWINQYRQRLERNTIDPAARRQAMHRINPKYILRNYLAQEAIDKTAAGQYDELARLQQVLAHPYEEQEQFNDYAKIPPDWASKIEVSCSS